MSQWRSARLSAPVSKPTCAVSPKADITTRMACSVCTNATAWRYVLLHIPGGPRRAHRGPAASAARARTARISSPGAARAGELAAHYRVSWTDSHGTCFEQVDPYTFASLVDPREARGVFAPAGTGRPGASSARTCMSHRRRAPACASPCGRRMRSASAWSAHSATGTGGAIRCACSAAAACGSCSFPGSAPASSTSSRSAIAQTGAIFLKSDPCARAGELRPATASIVAQPASPIAWTDRDWLERRAGARLAARADEHLRGAPRLVAAACATAAS